MPTAVENPGVSAGALVTVAFLKAQMDAGSDHLGIFMPLVLDVASRLPISFFTVEDVQLALESTHSVSMPKHLVATLLRRASKGYLIKESGTFRWNPRAGTQNSTVDTKKEMIERGQRRLAEALISHAQRRKVTVQSADDALKMLFGFLEKEQIALLSEMPSRAPGNYELDQRESSVVAEFIESIVLNDPAFLSVLRAMLEGLVLYHAAFLPDLNNATRRFRNLRVVFDGSLVREALGYAGPPLRSLLREAIEVLKSSGVECTVFEKTLEETRSILAMYEARLATTRGCAELKPSPMTRNFLTQRQKPSDMVELSTFLARDTAAAGFRILPSPPREDEFTAGERKLAARLRRPNAGPELDMEPRIVHDVECIAGVLTLRMGRRSNLLEDAGVVFATDSTTVIRSVQTWWQVDEEQTSVPPIVHIRALTNLAWLKKPALCGDLKIQELVVLCAAALQPKPATWESFRRHLSRLQKSDRITSDEAAAILVSEMLDRALKSAELESDDPDNVEVATLDEAVERVKAVYATEAARKVQQAEEEKTARVADAAERMQQAIDRADAAERSTAESARKRALRIQARARKWAHPITQAVRWTANIILLVGAYSLIAEQHFRRGLVGIVSVCGILFVFFEFYVLRNHITAWLIRLEETLQDHLLSFFGIDD
jgi:hypothetical protein